MGCSAYNCTCVHIFLTRHFHILHKILAWWRQENVAQIRATSKQIFDIQNYDTFRIESPYSYSIRHFHLLLVTSHFIGHAHCTVVQMLPEKCTNSAVYTPRSFGCSGAGAKPKVLSVLINVSDVLINVSDVVINVSDVLINVSYVLINVSDVLINVYDLC